MIIPFVLVVVLFEVNDVYTDALQVVAYALWYENTHPGRTRYRCAQVRSLVRQSEKEGRRKEEGRKKKAKKRCFKEEEKAYSISWPDKPPFCTRFAGRYTHRSKS